MLSPPWKICANWESSFRVRVESATYFKTSSNQAAFISSFQVQTRHCNVWGTRASLAEWLLASAPSWLERLEAHSGRNQLANGSLTNKTWDPTDLRSILVGFRLGELSSTMHFFQSPPKVETSRREIPKHSGSKTEKKKTTFHFPRQKSPVDDTLWINLPFPGPGRGTADHFTAGHGSSPWRKPWSSVPCLKQAVCYGQVTNKGSNGGNIAKTSQNSGFKGAEYLDLTPSIRILQQFG